MFQTINFTHTGPAKGRAIKEFTGFLNSFDGIFQNLDAAFDSDILLNRVWRVYDDQARIVPDTQHNLEYDISWETDEKDRMVFQIKVPGYKRENICLLAKSNRIEITLTKIGKTSADKAEQKFQYSIYLNPSFNDVSDPTKIESKLEDGILYIYVPSVKEQVIEIG